MGRVETVDHESHSDSGSGLEGVLEVFDGDIRINQNKSEEIELNQGKLGKLVEQYYCARQAQLFHFKPSTLLYLSPENCSGVGQISELGIGKSK